MATGVLLGGQEYPGLRKTPGGPLFTKCTAGRDHHATPTQRSLKTERETERERHTQIT